MQTSGTADGEGGASLQKLLDDGWDYHDSESERLARELEAAVGKGVPSSVLSSFLLLSTHTIGEHLGDWARALRLGKRVLEGREPAAETAKAWGRMYVAAILAGDPIEAAALELASLQAAGDDFGLALLDMRFMLASALAGARRAPEGARLFRSALALVRQFRQSPLMDRTIAATGNNLGWDLYEMRSRTADEAALMQLCATASLEFWRRCGNWINAEQALYLNAVVANVSGNAASGLAHADEALALIAANGERPLDAALLQLARAVSLADLGRDDASALAIVAADAAAAKLAAAELRRRFAAERTKVVAAAAAASND
jgi:hypothetical protein